MKIIESFPPNYGLIKAAFPNLENLKPVFCYGDTIYNPFGVEMTKDLIEHEAVHSRQQGDMIDLWYEKYLNDSAFRLEQEVEAYGYQLAFFRKHANNYKLTEWLKEQMAFALSGEGYGNIISYAKAESAIRNYAKTCKI